MIYNAHISRKSRKTTFKSGLILGYKGFMLCWSDGRTQFMLDASLHGEKGKVEGKEQGLSAKQRQRRYNRKRDENSHVANVKRSIS